MLSSEHEQLITHNDDSGSTSTLHCGLLPCATSPRQRKMPPQRGQNFLRCDGTQPQNPKSTSPRHDLDLVPNLEEPPTYASAMEQQDLEMQQPVPEPNHLVRQAANCLGICCGSCLTFECNQPSSLVCSGTNFTLNLKNWIIWLILVVILVGIYLWTKD